MKIRTESNEVKYILELNQQELTAIKEFIGKTSIGNRCDFGVSMVSSTLLSAIYTTILRHLEE